MRLKLLLLCGIFFVVIFLVGVFIEIFLFGEKTCGDGTPNGLCSSSAPFFCDRGVLVPKASVCGCPSSLKQEGDFCVSKYHTSPQKVNFSYVLDGKWKSLEFVVYEGVLQYFKEKRKNASLSDEKNVSRADFKLGIINDSLQRELVLPLVMEIRNLDKDRIDQLRIAVSLVQNLAYNESRERISVRGNEFSSFRFPYEVLYFGQGVCGERVNLLALLLRELGYGVAVLYYPEEDHEALGIKCSVEHSINGSGYCFVETTGPSIISSEENYYLGLGKLSSTPEIYVLFEGDSLENVREFADADEFDSILRKIREEGKITRWQKLKFERLKKRYGLDKIY